MSDDVTRQVATCDHCHKDFVIGEEGEAYTCDKCRDILLHNGAWGHPFQPRESELRDVV